MNSREAYLAREARRAYDATPEAAVERRKDAERICAEAREMRRSGGRLSGREHSAALYASHVVHGWPPCEDGSDGFCP